MKNKIEINCNSEKISGWEELFNTTSSYKFEDLRPLQTAVFGSGAIKYFEEKYNNNITYTNRLVID